MIDKDRHSPHAEGPSQSGAALKTDFSAIPSMNGGLGYPGKIISDA